MSYMNESIKLGNINSDCPSFHHFYVHVTLKSEIPYLLKATPNPLSGVDKAS